MEEKEKFREAIIEMVNNVKSEDVLIYIYKMVNDIAKEDLQGGFVYNYCKKWYNGFNTKDGRKKENLRRQKYESTKL